MTTETKALNQDFQIDPETEARLRAEAAAAVKLDEKALLAQFIEEEKAKQLANLREKAAELAQDTKQDLNSHGFPKKYFKVNVFKGAHKTDLSYVPVSVNGYAWQLRRGVPVIVPSVVIEALEHAITEQVTKSEGGLETTPVHRFPFNILGEATQEEYDAFVAANRKAGGKAAAA